MGRLLVFLPFAFLLAACGGSGSYSSQGGTVVRTIRISAKEFSLSPSAVTLSHTGTYAFELVNDGQTLHALEIQGNGVEKKIGEVAPGSSATLKVDLSKGGSYAMYCPVDGHKGQGMKGTITVGSGSGGGTTTGATTTGQTTTGGRPGY